MNIRLGVWGNTLKMIRSNPVAGVGIGNFAVNYPRFASEAPDGTRVDERVDSAHNDYVEFRNIRIKDLSIPETDNVPPAGFDALFTGKDLAGWKGLLNKVLQARDELERTVRIRKTFTVARVSTREP